VFGEDAMRGSDRTGAIEVKRPERAKKTRAQKSEEARAALFQAAAEIVGEYGYADASITRITQRANLAQGTFYNYFASRQDIFDELLPVLGAQMMEHIRHRAVGGKTFLEREELAFRAFFSYLKKAPYFLRILNEAEMAAPKAFRQHLANISAGYVRFLQKAREEQQIVNVTDEEIEAVGYVFMAARGYLALRYAKFGDVPEHVVSAYMRLVSSGLCGQLTPEHAHRLAARVPADDDHSPRKPVRPRRQLGNHRDRL
jgi:AcrR family transcriptional regulator